ncbi:hypothetical protein L7F22_058108 [Adiantum nelumboides]|nr:hypothetical protein [Adiantum nelumboides]
MQDHEHRDCDDFNEAYKKSIVFWKDNKFHLRATGESICVNFGQGGMKKLAKGILHNVTMVDAAIYGLQVISKANEDDAKDHGELWSSALKMVERGKVSRGKLCEAGNCICETIGWSNPVDLMLVYAYIAKSEAHEAWVEEKCKRDEEIVGSSRRATRSNNKKEEVSRVSPEVNMEDAPKDKKQDKPRGPSYKLKSKIELATHLKKVFEEHILNSKVEMIFWKLLSANSMKEIIDIIKRKRQIPSDQEPEGVKSQTLGFLPVSSPHLLFLLLVPLLYLFAEKEVGSHVLQQYVDVFVGEKWKQGVKLEVLGLLEIEEIWEKRVAWEKSEV